MGRKRRLGFYARKRAAADASEVADGDLAALLDELDEVNAAAEVAREMSASPICPITSEEIEQREFDAVLRELERSDREQRRAKCERINAISREEARRAEAVAAQRRHAEELAQASRERMARQAHERAAHADRERLAQLEQWARAQAAADFQRQQEGIAATKQQRVQTAYQNLMQTFDRILRPAELPPEPMQPAEPYQGSPHFGSPDFSPDAAIARFAPWNPWQP